MQILVEEQPSSVYLYDDWYSPIEIVGTKEILHMVFRCRHDWISVDKNGIYCPDCENDHLTHNEAEAYWDAYEREERFNNAFDPRIDG